jgi:hypothetical protein
MKKTFAALLLLTIVLGLVWWGCDMEPTRVTELSTEIEQATKPAVVGIERAIAVQNQHTSALMTIPDVVGTAVGLGTDGTPVVMVLTKGPGAQGIPGRLDGVPVIVKVTGEIRALKKPPWVGGGDDDGDVGIDPTSRFNRPVPIGVSTGHPAITAGTIGCRVKDANGNVYALSNNHVYAYENLASTGDAVIQPGTYDGGSSPADDIGTLAAFVPINFGGVNKVDAAIALSSNDELGNATPADGYGTPKKETVEAIIGQKVMKYGRTTGLTKGRVSGINATVNVGYGRGTALFTEQILITPGGFSEGGDSGSLVVTEDKKGQGRNPVGLLFAGSSLMTVANPIDAVLSQFNVTIDGE